MGDTLVNLATPGVVPHAHTAFDADLDLVDDLLHNFIKELETDGERVCVHTALPPPLVPHWRHRPLTPHTHATDS